MVTEKLKARDLKPGCKIQLPYGGELPCVPMHRDGTSMPKKFSQGKFIIAIYGDRNPSFTIKGTVTLVREETYEWDWVHVQKRLTSDVIDRTKCHSKSRFVVLADDQGREVYFDRALVTYFPFKRVVEDVCPCCKRPL